MRTIRLIIEYDGSRFHGWQEQVGQEGPTVQAALQEGLKEMTGEEIRVRYASRTDAGVHARWQVVAFETERDGIPAIGFERGIQRFLPRTVVVKRAQIVEDGWDPRGTSRGKRYRYTFLNDRSPSALLRERAWWVKNGRLDYEPMHRAAQAFIGGHHFDAFRGAGCVARHAFRRMYETKVEPAEYDTVIFEITGNAFVRSMVRIMAGTLCDVGLGRKTVDEMAEIIASRDRTRSGMTAPAHGLCLEEIIYDDRLPPKPEDDVDL